MDKRTGSLKNYTGKIEDITLIANEVYKFTVKSDLNCAFAGQFVSIFIPNKTFRRPFSIADFGEKEKTITLLIKLKGEGTKYLSSLKKGDSVDFLAPLGNSFKIENKKSLLVGAGIGIAPMLFLKKELDKKNINNYLVSGFRTEDDVIQGSDKNVIGGSVLDNLEKIIEEKKIEVIYSCGPKIVLEKLSNIAKKYNITCYVAMEKVMACSIGVCRGCTIKLKRNNEIVRASVCKDGTIFRGDEVIWE